MPNHPARPSTHRPKVLVAASILAIAGLGISAFSLAFLRPAVPEQVDSIQSQAEDCLTQDTKTECDPDESIVQSATPIPEQTTAEVTAEPIVNLYSEHPALDDRIGSITLPSLDLSWPIFEGTTETQLSKGVGHFVGSVLPGIRDNSVLSGHRTSVFGRLGELEISDLIMVRTSAGDFTYRVREFKVVLRTDRTVIVPTSTAVLTLTTCYPFDSPVATTEAFIVSADLIDSRLND
jgi:sortase A